MYGSPQSIVWGELKHRQSPGFRYKNVPAVSLAFDSLEVERSSEQGRLAASCLAAAREAFSLEYCIVYSVSRVLYNSTVCTQRVERRRILEHLRFTVPTVASGWYPAG